MLKPPKNKSALKKKGKNYEKFIEDKVPEAPKLADFEVINQTKVDSKNDCKLQDVDEESCVSLEDKDLLTCDVAEKKPVVCENIFVLDNAGLLLNKENDSSNEEISEKSIKTDSSLNRTHAVSDDHKINNNESNTLQYTKCENVLENKRKSSSEICNYSTLSYAAKELSHEFHKASAPTDENISGDIKHKKWFINSSNVIKECLDISKYKINIVIKDAITPFSDEKLSEFYHNLELEDVKNHINKIIHSEITDPSKHDNYFYRLLVEYIQSKNQLYCYEEKINELRKRLNVCISAMWTVWEDVKAGEETCRDGNTVSFLQKYTQAQFNKNIHDEFLYILKELKVATYENFLRESFVSSFLRLKIEYYLQCILTSCPEFTNLETDTVSLSCSPRNSYFQECLQHLKQVINVLFTFQRKENIDVDKEFLNESQKWLTDLVSVLLRVGTWKDQIFLLNHVLRCPGGITEWATSFIQLPSSSISVDPFNSEQINHIMTVLHIFLSPIDQNDHLIGKEDPATMNNQNPWMVVDSDGEIEGDTNQKIFLLKENDLVSILNQIPFEYLFKEIFQYRANEVTMPCVSSNYLLKLFSFSTDFIKILLNGLKLYSVKRYKQFNKRLGQLMCHIVHYAAEALTKFKSQNFLQDEMARIQAEYDNFFLKSIKFIYSAKKHGSWQFLATMPYQVVSSTTIFKIYALLQLNENQEESNLNVNFVSFEEKFCQLPEEGQYYLLTTFANMALARDISEIEFIRSVLLQLYYVGFVSSPTKDHSYKNVNHLLFSICSSHPFLISEILVVQNQLFTSNSAYNDQLSMYLWLKLPLDIWKPTDTDLDIISKWLLEPLNSLRSELARIILQSLNFGTSESELFLPPRIHLSIAFMLMQANVKLFKENEQGLIRNVSSLVYCQSPEQTVSEWTWNILLKLRLHLLDKPEACLYKYLTDMPQYLVDIPSVDWNIDLHNLVLKKYPIACFIALLTTNVGHSVPIIYNEGFDLVEVLLNDGKYSAAIACLEFITLLFLECVDSLYKCEKFIFILHQLITADNTYVQKAKSLILNNFPGPVLKSLENMIQNQLNTFRILNGNKFNECVRLWLLSLSRISMWNQETGVAYLMDTVLQNAFFNYNSAQIVTDILKNLSDGANSSTEVKSSFSSLVGWMNSKSMLPSLLPKGFNGDVPWLSYSIIQIEFEVHERQNNIWIELLKELHASRDKKTDVDTSLKKVCNLLGYPVRTSGSLAIYKWTYQILNTKIDHPLVPLLWQKFFCLYFYRGLTDCGSLGDKFFDGVTNQRLFKQLNQKVMETCNAFSQFSSQEEDSEEEIYIRKCQKLFQTFSLWLNDSKLHEPHLSIYHLSPDYYPELLGLLVHGSDTPWIDVIDHKKIEENFQSRSKNWLRLKGRTRNRKISESVSFKIEKSQAEVLKERFNSYETPLPLPPLVQTNQNMISKINLQDLTDPEKFVNFIRPHVDKIMAYRDQYMFLINQNISLGFDLQELSTKLFEKTVTQTILQGQCLGINKSVGAKINHFACSGPAVINLKYEEWKSNDKIQRQFDQCKEALDKNILKNLSHLPSYLSVSAVSIDVAIEELKKEYNLAIKRQSKPDLVEKLKESGVDLFYEFMEKWNDNVEAVSPLERAFDRYVNILGKTFLENNERENESLLHYILKNDGTQEKLLKYFTPNAATTPYDFVKNYSTALECESPKKLLTVLSKFDLIQFLDENEPKFSVRSALISSIGRKLTLSNEKTLPTECQNVNKVLNDHLGILLKYDFPEHYGEVLNLLLECSRKQSISNSTWFIFLNSLIFDASFSLEHGLSIKRLKQYFIKSASDQGIPLDVVRGTMTVLASNFNNERSKLGVYGLYGKYEDYVEPIFIFFGILSHSCVAKTLEQDTGSLSEKLTQKLWPLLSDLYSPWLIPYRSSTEDVKKDKSGDASVWLPWTPNNVSSASFCASIFVESVRFILDTLPGFNNVLSYLWYFYVCNFAQVHVKDFVLNIVHEALATLPWETFFPSLQDVELMVQVVNQYLPLCHSFLGNIFVNVKWTELVQYCRDSGDDDLTTKFHICLLHLLIKLPLEPSLKQNKKVLALLNEAKDYSWHFIDARSYEVVLNWFVTSCDPRIILMDERLDYYKLDSAIYALLKVSAGYTTTAKQFHPTTLTKRATFIKACVNWLISSNRRFKSKDSPLFKKALWRMWDEMHSVVTETVIACRRVDEMIVLLSEFYQIFTEPGLSSFVEDAMCDWIPKSPSQVVIFSVLRSAGSSIENHENYGRIIETSIECYFDFVEDSNWSEILQLLVPFAKTNTQMDKVVIYKKCFLTLYVSLLKKMQENKSRSNTKSLLTDLLHILTEEKLSFSVEPKMLLLIILCLQLIESEMKFNIKDGIALLIRLVNVLNDFVDDKGSGFLSAVGLRKPAFSNRYKLVCLCVCGCIVTLFKNNSVDSYEKIGGEKIFEALETAESNKIYQGINQYVSHAKAVVQDVKTIKDIIELVKDVGYKLFNVLYLK